MPVLERAVFRQESRFPAQHDGPWSDWPLVSPERAALQVRRALAVRSFAGQRRLEANCLLALAAARGEPCLDGTARMEAAEIEVQLPSGESCGERLPAASVEQPGLAALVPNSPVDRLACRCHWTAFPQGQSGAARLAWSCAAAPKARATTGVILASNAALERVTLQAAELARAELLPGNSAVRERRSALAGVPLAETRLAEIFPAASQMTALKAPQMANAARLAAALIAVLVAARQERGGAVSPALDSARLASSAVLHQGRQA